MNQKAQQKEEMQLKEIAEIQIGYQHRDELNPISRSRTGSHQLIQIKDIDLEERHKSLILERGGAAPYVWLEGLQQFTPPGNASRDASRYRVNKGNVLFLSRGARLVAIAITEPLENVIASYYFYILRLRSSCLLPEYLAWAINQNRAQLFFEKHRQGSRTKMLSKSAFAELAITIPPLRIQRAIVGVERTRQKEEDALKRHISAQRRLVNALALQAVLRESSNGRGGRRTCQSRC